MSTNKKRTQKDLAVAADVSETTTSRWARKGYIVRAKGGGVDIEATLRRVAARSDRRGGTLETDPDILASRAKYEHWHAENERLKAEKEAGNLIEYDATLEAMSDVVLAARDRFLGLPARIAASVTATARDGDEDQATHAVRIKLDEEIRGVLALLAEGLG